MKVRKILIKKKDFSHFSENEQILLLQIGIMLNEINILHKIMLLSSKETVSRIEGKGRIIQSLFFLSLLVGKLWECWQGLDEAFFDAKLSKEYEARLSPEGRVKLSNLKRHFSGRHWMKAIRNRFSFHYGPNEIGEQIERMSEDELLEFYLTESQGTSLYYSSGILQLSGILQTIDDGNDKAALERYFSESLEIADDFLGFLNHLEMAIVEKYPDLEFDEIEIPDPPSVRDLSIPYFVVR